MKFFSFLLVVVLVCIIGVVFGGEPCHGHVEAHPPVGHIKGSIIKSRHNRDVYAFRGVRYAESPTGQLRFEPPVPVADWTGVFDASQEGPGCPGLATDFGLSEDCLRLNVYTTRLPKNDRRLREAGWPVLVFFPPGGFYTYSAQSLFLGPHYLLDKDIVLVTVNYRLASLGLLSTGDSYAPGNQAFKDQVVALKWVKRNIASFGGDPNSVTIGGHSAGSFSVMLHMVSPLSAGLFHRVIGMSGSVIGGLPLAHDQRALAVKQAELIGCPTDNSRVMIACMKTKPVENFTDTIASHAFYEFRGDPLFIWRPVVEPAAIGDKRFICEQPVDSIRKRRFATVPTMMGVSKDEFGSMSSIFVRMAQAGNFTLFDELNKNWERFAPFTFSYERGTERSKQISRALFNFYFHDKPISLTNLQGISAIYADLVIFPVHRAVGLLSDYSPLPVYLYKFTEPGRYSFAMWNDTTPLGVVHQDELQYLFHVSTNFPFYNETAPEGPAIELMTTMWTTFMKTGYAIPSGDDRFKDVVWERYSKGKDNYLNIKLNPVMERGLYPDRMREWNRLIPLSTLSEE